MAYLELEELVIGRWYPCIFYNGDRENLVYRGKGVFANDETTYSVYGDIRYVLDPKHIPSSPGISTT